MANKWCQPLLTGAGTHPKPCILWVCRNGGGISSGRGGEPSYGCDSCNAIGCLEPTRPGRRRIRAHGHADGGDSDDGCWQDYSEEYD